MRAVANVDGEGLLIAPGYIDIQLNGGWGVDLSFDCDNYAEGLKKVSKHLLAHGVTSYCPTVVTSEVETYHRILPLLKYTQGGKHGATVLGAHLEGPFVNIAEKGGHPPECVMNPKGLKLAKDVYGSLENVVMITMAPELPGALQTIKEFTDYGIKVSLGHSRAKVAEGEKGIEHGASLITHIFNAMPSFLNRDPGLIGLLASSTKNQIYYGIIANGIHTHPTALRIACRTNPQGLVLVSDAVAAQGLSDGNHVVGDTPITIEGDYAYLAGTKVLYGNTTALDKCVAIFKQTLDCSLEYVLEAASLQPAKAIGIDHRKGKLNYGYDADFVFIHPDSLKIKSTWIAGECVYKSDKVI